MKRFSAFRFPSFDQEGRVFYAFQCMAKRLAGQVRAICCLHERIRCVYHLNRANPQLLMSSCSYLIILARLRARILIGLLVLIACREVEGDTRPFSVDEEFQPVQLGIERISVLRADTSGGFFVGGSFSTPRAAFAKLLPNGSIDPAFKLTQGFTLRNEQAIVYSIEIDELGRIYVGGRFSAVDGTPRSNLCRLLPDGTVDQSFAPVVNGLVYTCLIKADASILIGGGFTSINGQSRSRLAKLNTAGDLDQMFNLGDGPNRSVTFLYPSDPSHIYISGGFDFYNDQSSYGTIEIDSNGDRSGQLPFVSEQILTLSPLSLNRFIVGTSTGGSIVSTDGIQSIANGSITCSARDLHERSVVAGNFTSIFNARRTRIARISATGVLESAFSADEGPNDIVQAITVLTNGQIVIAGRFTMFGNVPTPGFAKLHGDFVPPGMRSQLQDQMLVEGGVCRFRTDVSGNDLTWQWFKDGKLLSQTTNFAFAITNVAATDSGAYSFIAYNEGGTATSSIVRLNVVFAARPGAPDSSFTRGTNIDEISVVRASDTEVCIGGNFESLNQLSTKYLAVLNTNGVIKNISPVRSPQCVALIHDNQGRWWAGGYGGRSDQPMLSVYNFSNSSTFEPIRSWAGSSEGHVPAVYQLETLPDGSVVALGDFDRFSESALWGIARFTSDLERDLSYGKEVTIRSGAVRRIAVLPDGKLLVSGSFRFIDVNSKTLQQPGLFKLASDGTFDTGFDAHLDEPIWDSTLIKATRDGGFILTGRQPLWPFPVSVQKMNESGALDHSFQTQNIYPQDGVSDCVVQPWDGKILLAGTFTRIGTNSVGGLARLNADGSLDNSFFSGGSLPDICLGPDGSIYSSGSRFYNGVFGGVLRLKNDFQIGLRLGVSQTSHQIAVHYETDLGRHYRLRRSTDLLNWEDFLLSDGDGVPVQYQLPKTGSAGFFELIVE